MPRSSQVVWEIRPANGTANAGGGFNSTLGGSDFSQSDAVYLAFDGVGVTATTGGASSTLSFVGYAPLGNDAGNLCAITGGVNFLPGIYEIGTSDVGAGTWTMHTNVTSGAGSAMTGNMGGARLGYHKGSPVTSLSSTLVAGNTVFIKNEAWNEAVVLAIAGTVNLPVKHIGYNATRGDIDLGDGNANNPLNDRASAAGVVMTVSGSFHFFDNINVTRAGTSGWSATAMQSWRNCRSYNNGADGWTRTGTATFNLVGCEGDTNASDGIENGSTGATAVSYSYLHDNTGIGIAAITSGSKNPITFNVIDANGSHGLSLGASPWDCLSNTIFANGGNGILVTTPTAQCGFMNNIVMDNASFGASATESDLIWADFNNYFRNNAGARNNFPAGMSDLAIDPQFTSASTGDFSIAASLPGFPGAFARGQSTGFLKMGAVQPQASGSGTSETIIVRQPVVIAPNNVVIM